MNKKATCSLLFLVACGSGTEPPDPPLASWGAPISGGTMIATRDGLAAVIADPDRDRAVIVDLSNTTVPVIVPFTTGDEPGRLVEDGAGRIHIALRRGGAIATIDRAGAITFRRAVCPEPRGVAWSSTDDVVHVACTDGRLVTFPAAGGDATRTLQLDGDLRDVVVAGDQLVVTRFRTAEVLTLDATGAIVHRGAPPAVQRNDFDFDGGPGGIVDATAAVAWRAVPVPDGRVLVLHQRKLNKQLGTGQGQTDGYGGGCGGGGPVEDGVSLVQPGSAPTALKPWLVGSLPVDLAVSPNGSELAAISAGQHTVVLVDAVTALGSPDVDPCPFPGPEVRGVFVDGLGAPTSVAFTTDSDLLVYYPEVPALVVHPTNFNEPRTMWLPGEFGYDAGRELFHTASGVGIACASCHPEGRDDGQVWDFTDFGVRRTQSVAGNILARAPYHWNGDQVDLSALVSEVFEGRMAGGPTTDSQKRALGQWLDRIPAPAPIARDAAAVERGRVVFEAADVGCISCHNGPLFTNNVLVNVGTGGLFKVPSLRGIAARAPFIHTGCAPTLLDRLTDPSCGGGDQHGATSHLTAEQLGDLVAYLESL